MLRASRSVIVWSACLCSQLLTRISVSAARLFVEHLGIEPFSFFSTSVDRAETTEGLASQRELINNAYNQVSVFFFFFFSEQKRINYWIQLVVWEGFAACLILSWQETEYVWVSGCMSDRISTVWRTSRCPWEEKKKDTMKDILSHKKKSSLKLNSWFLIRGFKLCVEKCQSCHSLNFEDIYLSRSW